MALENRLFVFTNDRNIRNFNQEFNDEFLPKSISFSEFLKCIIYHKDKIQCDEVGRILLMQEACKKSKDLAQKMKFPQEFTQFLKNSEYLFSFFKELALQKKSVDDLFYSDIYANYEEHLKILDELLKSYKNNLNNAGVYDDISICDDYFINEEFVAQFDEIHIKIDGFLSKFEFEILLNLTKITQIFISFTTSKFNKKMTLEFADILNTNFEENCIYDINLTKKEIISCEKREINSQIKVKSFNLRSLQCAYVFEKISSFVKDGIDPQKIAVILPDESFAKILKSQDKNNMLNFAMGFDFKDSIFYQIFNKAIICIKENKDIVFKDDYLKNDYFDDFSMFFYKTNFKKELYERFKIAYLNNHGFDEFKKICEEMLLLDESSSDIVQNSLFDLGVLNDKFSLEFKSLCEIFLQKISKEKISHVSGGQVSVMGLLESRGMSFDGVIIVDFSDDFVPKRSINEMFLNSEVRANAGLISHTDRENLQRFFYENLIFGAKKAAICFEKSEERIASRFLKQFCTIEDKEFSNDQYLSIFGCAKVSQCKELDEIVLKHNIFETPLSFSRLDTFLKCERKYYYKYILKCQEPKALQGISRNYVGTIIHNCFDEFYKNSADKKFDLRKFDDIFENKLKDQGVREFEILLWRKRLEKIAKLLQTHEEEYIYEDSEVKKDTEFCDIKITGEIDRIDKNGNKKFIIDYKSGNVDANSLQLAFYEALLDYKDPSDNVQSKFLSLTSGEFIESKKNLDDLIEIIEELKNRCKNEINFSRTQKDENCKYCAYKIMCKRQMV